MAGLLAALSIRMILRVRTALRAGESSALHSPTMALLLTAILGFCGLLLLDAQPSSASNSSRASLIALAVSMIALLLVSASVWHRHTATAVVAAAGGLLGAVISVLACVAWPPTVWQLILFGLATFAPAVMTTLFVRRNRANSR